MDFLKNVSAVLILAIAALPILNAKASATDACINDGDTVELSGKLWREAFPGPPNYESIENGDQPQVVWILTTEEAFCGNAMSFETEQLYRIDGELTRFQLVLNQEQYEANQSLVFENIKVSGIAFAGHTGHHHTSMLINVERLEEAD